MNNKIFIIIGREYLTRVRKKTFILLTLLMPFLMAALCATPILLGAVKDNEQKTVVVVDETGHYAPLFQDTEQFRFVTVNQMQDDYRSESSDMTAVLHITNDLCTHPQAATIYSHEEVQIDLRRAIEDVLNDQIRRDKLSAYNIPQLDKIIDDVQADFSVQTVKWDENGKETISSSDVATVVGLLFTMFIYMFVMSYGGMVMSGVTEEKTNRIMEVMVSSVRPFQLMMGKIIGVLLVGLTQMLIWGVMLLLILCTTGILLTDHTSITTAMQSAAATSEVTTATPDLFQLAMNNDITRVLSALPVAEIVVMFLLYFLGGYLLYASIFAGCGAAVDSQEDSSQFMMPVIILMIFGLYAAIGSMENTNGPLAFWTSLIPFTSPIVMMLRIPLGVPLWQEILSLTILYATAISFVWIGARIYRVGILMYGKKPSFHELWKWLRYS